MSLKNTKDQYGWPSIALHWLMAVALIGMYFSGDYMVDLGYYDTLYHKLPGWHKSVGILIAACLLVRVLWNYSQQRPEPANPKISRLTNWVVALAHLSLYGLTAALVTSGYLISTAKGAPIVVFSWFEFPALLASSADRGETAGDLHEIFGNVFIGLVALHVIATLYHHFFLKDNTLKRMLRTKGKTT